MKTAALVSGGLDSCVMLGALMSTTEIYPVYVRAGLSWEDAETYWLGRLLASGAFPGVAPLTMLDLPCGDLYAAHWSISGASVPDQNAGIDSNYLPGRNLLLLSKAVVFCAVRGIDGVAMAPLADNPFGDGAPEFFTLFEAATFQALGRRVHIDIPFRRLRKSEVIRRAGAVPLGLTFSCIRPVGLAHCGQCTKCAERRQGFADAGVADPTRYAVAQPGSA